MKTINLIRIALFVFVLFASYKAQAQKKEPVLIANETTMTELAASIKIQTSNEKIFNLITAKYGSIMKSYSVKVKKDRAGTYQEYSIPFKKDIAQPVIDYIKSLK